MTTFDILFQNWLDSVEMVEECLWQEDRALTIRWSVIADTFASLI